MEPEEPKPLDYAEPPSPRLFEQALTDYVRQETAAGRMPHAAPRWHRAVLYLLIAAAVAAAVVYVVSHLGAGTDPTR